MDFIRFSLLVYLSIYINCFISCNNDDYNFDYEVIVTKLPVNLEKINSRFDDYNSTLPYPVSGGDIFFSSNRNTYGNEFDINHKNLSVSYHRKEDILNISYSNTGRNKYVSELLKAVNSVYDELGPYYFFGQGAYEYFFFSNNQSGNFDILFASSKKSDFGTFDGKEEINRPIPIKSINSDYDDMYPSIFNNNSEIIFCSNRENGIFNIYISSFTEDEIDPEIQEDQINAENQLIKTLSSNHNDMCPFTLEDVIVFASDREGGFGGYDLYYSRNLNGKWTPPENLGDKINSAHDEYRPVIVPFLEFHESMLIFSSDRPGGKGGFDLYAVRTDKIDK